MFCDRLFLAGDVATVSSFGSLTSDTAEAVLNLRSAGCVVELSYPRNWKMAEVGNKPELRGR